MPRGRPKKTNEDKCKYIKRNDKAGVIFPITRLLRLMKKGHYMKHIGVSGAVYMSAVL